MRSLQVLSKTNDLYECEGFVSIYPILTEQTGIEGASRPGNEESEKKSVEKLNSRLYDDW